MSVNGALFAGVSGLKAELSALGVISNNISNANTVGYKAGSGDFSTLVTNTNGGGSDFSPGGVLAKSVQHVDAQGLLQASTSNTDVGISGRGFFVVANQLTPQGTVSSTTPRDYTRAGSFTLDKSGNLVNTSGFFLLGVPTDTKGNPITANPVVQNLQPVNVGTLTGIAKGTTELSVGANVPAVPSSPSHLTVSGTLDGVNSFLDPTHYVMYSSAPTSTNGGGAAYDTQVMYNLTSASGTVPATYDIQLVNITPIANASPLSTTQTVPITVGTVTVSASGGTVSGGQPVSFQDGTTLAPVLNATGLKLSTTQGNNVDRAAVDAQDIATTVYDSLGVAQTLTLEMSRGNDVGRTATSPVNNISLAGSLDTTALAGTSVALPGTTLLTASDGTTYRATLQISVTAANAGTLDVTSLTPMGNSSLDPTLAFPVSIASLAIASTGTTVTTIGPNFIDSAGTVSIGTSLASQINLKDTPGVATTGLAQSNNTTFTVTAPTQNEWVTSIRDMRVSATGQPSVIFPLSTTSTGAPGAITGFPIYLNGTAASAVGIVSSATNFLSLSGSFDSGTAATIALGSMRVTSAQGNSYMATVSMDAVSGVVSATALTSIGNAPSAAGVVPLTLGTVAPGVPSTFAPTAVPNSFALAGTDTLDIEIPTNLTNLNNGAASNSVAASLDIVATPTTVPTTSVIQFNSDGTLKSGAPTTIPALTMTTGASPFGGANFTLNFGTPNTAGGLTQFTDQFAISFINQDGVRFGFRTGVSFDATGLVSAVFDNGQSIPLFKVPLVNFANANDLQAISGDVYGQTTDSGDPVPNFPGVGGAGQLSPSTLEASTVDLSTEFANLIITQRTFSADAKTITTSDQMLQELLTIKQ